MLVALQRSCLAATSELASGAGPPSRLPAAALAHARPSAAPVCGMYLPLRQCSTAAAILNFASVWLLAASSPRCVHSCRASHPDLAFIRLSRATPECWPQCGARSQPSLCNLAQSPAAACIAQARSGEDGGGRWPWASRPRRVSPGWHSGERGREDRCAAGRGSSYGSCVEAASPSARSRVVAPGWRAPQQACRASSMLASSPQTHVCCCWREEEPAGGCRCRERPPPVGHARALNSLPPLCMQAPRSPPLCTFSPPCWAWACEYAHNGGFLAAPFDC